MATLKQLEERKSKEMASWERRYQALEKRKKALRKQEDMIHRKYQRLASKAKDG